MTTMWRDCDVFGASIPGQDITTRQTNETYAVWENHYKLILDYKTAFL